MGGRANTAGDAGGEGSLAIIHADADYVLGKLDNYPSMLSSSTSKISTASGPMSGGEPRFP